MKHKLINGFLIVFFGLLISACASQETKEGQINQLKQAQQEEIKPDYAKAAMLNAQLGIHYTKEGMLDFAKRKILKAQTQDDDLAIVHYALGYYYQASGDIQKANDAYKKALSIDSDNPQAIIYYAAFLCAQNQYQNAQNYFKKAIKLADNTNLGQSYQAFGVCQKNNQNFTDAKYLFGMALKQNPDLPLSYYSLAQIYYLEKNYTKADQYIRYYQKNYPLTAASMTLEMDIAEKLHQGSRAATLRLELNSM
ncbi:tetratricopeptide repeat protein [Thiotrichales bacterium 19X7-9]|nr:tetratricopeptide repeat protein [Thiotrichales bacterium 19X7-9]